MYDHILVLVRGSSKTLACLIVLSLLEKGKWIDRLALRRIVSAVIGKKMTLMVLDEILRECESFLDVSYISNCSLSLPRRNLCEIIRIKPRYHHLFKDKLIEVLKILRINRKGLISFYRQITPFFWNDEKKVCPLITFRCFKSEVTPSLVHGEPHRQRYSLPQLKRMIQRREITPREAFLYLPIDTQLIALILYRLQKFGDIHVSIKFLSDLPARVSKTKWPNERIEKAIRPLEALNLISKGKSKGIRVFQLLYDIPEQLFYITESLETENKTKEILKKIRDVSASTGLDKTLSNLKTIMDKFKPLYK